MRKCYHDHNPILLSLGGKMTYLYGGNGYTPAVKADVYIDLNPRKDVKAFVEYKTKDGGMYINFPIVNMQVPNLTRLKEMVQVMITLVKQGKDIHVGCIGGHGRTGLVIVALLATIHREKTGEIPSDLISKVRAAYCSKAVESQQQVDYLVKNFGQEPVEPRKYPKVNWVTPDL